MQSISVVIPTYNAAPYLPVLLKSLKQQTLCHELIIIDSGSKDGTEEIVKTSEAKFITIEKQSFNHGTTRNLGVELSESDVIIFMTQDALPATPETFEHLVAVLLSNDKIAMAYGRQLPYHETGVFGKFARLANYPAESVIKTKEMIPTMGIKTCSCSNSFAAYRKADLLAVGGFPSDTILGEDVSVAARFILRGQAVAYCAESQVYHSHDYTVYEEFKRYFDIGVFHYEQRAILNEFSKAESEGLKYVLQELTYLREHGYQKLIPAQILRTVAKYIGYKMGRLESRLPRPLKRRLSMHPNFWNS